MPASIRHRGGDGWQVRVSLGWDPDTGRYRYASRYVHATKLDARRAAAALAMAHVLRPLATRLDPRRFRSRPRPSESLALR